MIPRIIHYCWFGRGPKPAEALRFIAGWRRLHPDFSIIEWNEDNFDVTCSPYVRQAYERRRFAFVSDYARGEALLRMGGVYIDTDVELVARLDSLLAHEGFLGFEHGNSVATSTMGFRPGHPLMAAYMRQYAGRQFVRPDGGEDTTTNVAVLTRLAQAAGLRLDGARQEMADGVVCLPMQVLSPLDYVNLVDHRDESTVAIHHYQHSWGNRTDRVRRGLVRAARALLGERGLSWLRAKMRRGPRGAPPA